MALESGEDGGDGGSGGAAADLGPEERLALALDEAPETEQLEVRASLAVGAFARGRLSRQRARLLAGMAPGIDALLARVAPPAGVAGAASAAPLVSVVIPVLNEETNLPTLGARLLPVLRAIGPHEVVFVDDGSSDGSIEAIRRLRSEDPAVKLVRLSRNFGHQSALSAGLDHATGQCVVLMDADLQDPPELLLELVARWREGYHTVYAVRQNRKEPAWKRASYFAFYRLLHGLARLDIPLDAGDFCLMDRCVVDHIRALPERNRFLRGLRSWVGFRQIGVPYERLARHAGEPKYDLRRLTHLAFDGLVGFTSAPLQLASGLGLLTAAAGVAYLLFALLARLLRGQVPPGWTSLIAITLVVGGAQLLVTGMLGAYVARIYEETKRRPSYVVADRLGFEERRPASAPFGFEERPASAPLASA